MTEAAAINIHDHSQKLRDTWQARVLAQSAGKTQAVVLIILSHTYTHVIKTLLRVVFPGFRDIQKPFLSSGATIALSGKVICDMVDRSGLTRKVAIYESTDDLNRDMRGLADRLKFSDAERVAFTAAIQKWVVADERFDHLGRRKLDA